MDDKAIRRAALVTVRRAILERFPPGTERERGCGGQPRHRLRAMSRPSSKASVARLLLSEQRDRVADVRLLRAGWYPVEDFARATDGHLKVHVGRGADHWDDLHVHDLPAQDHRELQGPRADEPGARSVLRRYGLPAPPLRALDMMASLHNRNYAPVESR